MTAQKPTIALVYDKLNTEYGGAEHVLKSLLELYPHAPLYTSIHIPEKTPWIDPQRVRTSWLNNLPWLKYHFTFCAPLLPLAFESLDLSEFDTVISITSGEAKGVLTTPDQTHICYLLTPPRYLYSHRDEYKQSIFLARLPIFSWLFDRLRDYQTWWDTVAAYRPDVTIPISHKVAQRVKHYYHRDCAQVIYPPLPDTIPLDTKGIHNWPDFKYFLSASRLVDYKRIDLAISTSIQVGRKLIVVGDGPESMKLQQLAGTSAFPVNPDQTLEKIVQSFAQSDALTLFVGHRTEAEVALLMHHCTAFILPGIEDFGIAPLQAASHGKPVIIHRESGVAEILTEPECGVHLTAETSEEAARNIKNVTTLQFNNEKIKKIVEKYEKSFFKKNFAEAVTQINETF